MKLLLELLVIIFLFAITSGFLSSSCKKWSKKCQSSTVCCPIKGHRVVCAHHQKICGTKTCCITEVEAQQEKQASIFRNRRPKSK
ncbi:unnamed protein product [Rotaria sp. Silwood2]|nr:unnamed protein product [Rotaria sp. Silwood2]CAF4337400.1 unnamed protein product [Rotaria sp. Silwood2]